MATYFFDTCVWRDHYENRFGKTGRPLGEYATRLFIKVIANKDTLLFSELVVRELASDFDEQDIQDMLSLLFIAGILKKVAITEAHYQEAKRISTERGVSTGDALHALLARENDAVLVSQDEHMQKLKDMVMVKKPEEI